MRKHLKKLLGRWYCDLFGHIWRYSPGAKRRICVDCLRREVMTFKSRFQIVWSEHTYPLNADPAKDPTRICIDGICTTLGEEYQFNHLLNEVTTGNLPFTL